MRRLASLPDGVELRGKLAAAYGWSDAAGQQLLVLGERQDERAADGTQSAMLYAAQYTLGQGKPRRQWMLSDGVERCEFDAGAGFDLDALSFPDLNRDGVLETVIGYHSTCTSDVSPNDYKLILHAGKAKYGLRGLDRQGMSWLDPEHGLSSAAAHRLQPAGAAGLAGQGLGAGIRAALSAWLLHRRKRLRHRAARLRQIHAQAMVRADARIGKQLDQTAAGVRVCLRSSGQGRDNKTSEKR